MNQREDQILQQWEPSEHHHNHQERICKKSLPLVSLGTKSLLQISKCNIEKGFCPCSTFRFLTKSIKGNNFFLMTTVVSFTLNSIENKWRNIYLQFFVQYHQGMTPSIGAHTPHSSPQVFSWIKSFSRAEMRREKFRQSLYEDY